MRTEKTKFEQPKLFDTSKLVPESMPEGNPDDYRVFPSLPAKRAAEASKIKDQILIEQADNRPKVPDKLFGPDGHLTDETLQVCAKAEDGQRDLRQDWKKEYFEHINQASSEEIGRFTTHFARCEECKDRKKSLRTIH